MLTLYLFQLMNEYSIPMDKKEYDHIFQKFK